MRNEAKYRPIRAQARELIVREGLTQKEVAQRLKIAPKTVSLWYGRHGWQDEREAHLQTAGKANSLYEFIAYARDRQPVDFPLIEALYKSYLNDH